MTAPCKYVIMGVCGCGKSTIGMALAERIGATYIDGDDLHPAANIGKMSRGEPLNDDDRLPWLQDVGRALRDAPGDCIVGCSALKRSYRDTIRAAAGQPVLFLHLAGDRTVLVDRMAHRTAHFMPTTLLDSQLETLDPPQQNEMHLTANIARPPGEIVETLALGIAGLASAARS